jgi:hypothetical protein
MAIPSTTGVSGQYLYVADGALEIDGRHYGVESLGWIGSGEPRITVTAGEGGARCPLTRSPCQQLLSHTKAPRSMARRGGDSPTLGSGSRSRNYCAAVREIGEQIRSRRVA